MFDSFWDNKLIKCASPRRGVKKSVKGFSQGCQLFLFSLIIVSCGSLEKRNEVQVRTKKNLFGPNIIFTIFWANPEVMGHLGNRWAKWGIYGFFLLQPPYINETFKKHFLPFPYQTQLHLVFTLDLITSFYFHFRPKFIF